MPVEVVTYTEKFLQTAYDEAVKATMAASAGNNAEKKAASAGVLRARYLEKQAKQEALQSADDDDKKMAGAKQLRLRYLQKEADEAASNFCEKVPSN